MERHGLPKYRQSPWLADALGLSYSQAHRRMTGASAWSLEDLERVGTLFGETLAQVVSLDSAPGSVAGSLKVGSTSVGCRLWLGEIAHNPRPDSLVAISTASGWTATPGGRGRRSARIQDRAAGSPSKRQHPQGHRRARRRSGPHEFDLRSPRSERLRGPAILQDGGPGIEFKGPALRRLRDRLDRRRNQHAETDRRVARRRLPFARSSC